MDVFKQPKVPRDEFFHDWRPISLRGKHQIEFQSQSTTCVCRTTHCQKTETKALGSFFSFRSGTLTKTKFQPCSSSENFPSTWVSHLCRSHRVTDDCADCRWARPLTSPFTTGTYHLVPVLRRQADPPPLPCPPASPWDLLPPPLLLQPAPFFFLPSFLSIFFFFFYCVLHNLLLPQVCALVFLLHSCDLLYDWVVHLSRWIHCGSTYIFILSFFHSFCFVFFLLQNTRVTSANSNQGSRFWRSRSRMDGVLNSGVITVIQETSDPNFWC